MKNHFFTSYFGNKRQEVEKIYEALKDNLENIDTFVEPFCGSSAVSYYIWLQNPTKKIKYILNDNNKFIYQLYKLAKDVDKFNVFVELLKDMAEKCTNKEEYLKIVKNNKTCLISYVFGNKIYAIRPYLYPMRKKIHPDMLKTFENAPIIKFLREADIEFKNEDGYKIYVENKTNPKCMIFMDPPYLLANNDFYHNPDVNIYEKLDENDIRKEKAYIILCLGNNWIIKLLFKDNKKITYDKKYETTHKKTEHIIITNK
jgi:site-specific DNA-adenine methylase